MIGELVKKGFMIHKEGMVLYVDNRTINVQGFTAENLQIGDENQINQIKLGSGVDIDRLFGQLAEFISQNSDPRDQQTADKVKENINKGKFDTAKEIFGLLSKAVQMSAAGVSIAKAMGWV